MTLKYANFIVEYKLTRSNVHIVDSYKICKKSDMIEIITAIRAKAADLGFSYKRNNRSWIIEWRAHNYMYTKNYKRERTSSVDLNENESWLNFLVYIIQSWLYRG